MKITPNDATRRSYILELNDEEWALLANEATKGRYNEALSAMIAAKWGKCLQEWAREEIE